MVKREKTFQASRGTAVYVAPTMGAATFGIALFLAAANSDSEAPEVKSMRHNNLTPRRVVMDYEGAQGRQVEVIHEKNLGYDVTSLDIATGEMRLIEVKGLATETCTILLSPNERRVAEDRRDCY